MRVIFPESENPIIKEALVSFPDLEVVPAPDLETATDMLARGEADSMVSGLDYSSRDVLLAYKAKIPLSSPFFSSCFVGKKDGKRLIIADGGVNKIPSKEQLYTIVEDTARTCEIYFKETPRIAMLSYSTKGSGGKNPDLEKIYYVIDEIKKNHPEWKIDGEMQLDAAIVESVAKSKAPESKVAGQANILIFPDLNAGNIGYKLAQRLGHAIAYGPLCQGLAKPVNDLSRGCTAEDIVGVVAITCVQAQSL